MADEELSSAQKLAIGANFVLNSPPAQVNVVMEDVRKLVGPSVLTPEKELGLLARVNKEKFAAVKVDGGNSVLITPHGELPAGLYLDPSGPHAIEVDHKALTATKSDTPLTGAQLAAIQGGAAIREAIDREMQSYCQQYVPGSTCTTYGTSGAGIKVVCCLSTRLAELSNYWAGMWISEWTLEVPMGGSMHAHGQGLDSRALFRRRQRAAGRQGRLPERVPGERGSGGRRLRQEGARERVRPHGQA